MQGLYAFGLTLGTLYSVPPFRLKVRHAAVFARFVPALGRPHARDAVRLQRFPLPAFMIIACVRGFLLNFGVYHATRSALRQSFEVRVRAPLRTRFAPCAPCG